MRKFQVIYAILFAAIVGVFSSCNTGDDNVAPVVTATIQGTPTYKPGTTVEIKLSITSSSDLKTFAVASDVIAISADCKVSSTVPADALKTATEFKSDLGTTGAVEILYSFKIPATAAKGTKTTVTFTITDKDDLVASAPVDITVANAVDGTLKTVDFTLGAQNNSVGSFAAAFDGTVYTIAQVEANQAKIDIVYYYGTTSKDWLAAPSDSDIKTFNWDAALSTKWSTRNSTMFKKVTATDYDNATYSSVAALAPTESGVKTLAAGDVLAIKTASGKYGVLKVTSVGGKADGQIKFSVKIQDAAPAK